MRLTAEITGRPMRRMRDISSTAFAIAIIKSNSNVSKNNYNKFRQIN